MQKSTLRWFFAVFSFFAVCIVSRGELRFFDSAAYRYSVEYPQEWYIDATMPTDTLAIDNFPASAAIHAVHLPKGGAEIMIRPAEALGPQEKAQSLDTWVRADTAREEAVSRRNLDVEVGQARIQAIEVRGHDRGDPPVFEWTDWYFQIGDRMFKSTLLYWQGDPEADGYLETMKKVVQSLRIKPNR